MTLPTHPPHQQDDPEGARPAGRGYWFTPLPTYLLDAVYDPESQVNAPAAMLWAHVHRHYAWRERIFPSFATLAEETGQGERTVRRLLQALKDAGALTWGATFSSKGRSSNEYALAPVKPFEFDRAPTRTVAAKNGRDSEVVAKSGHHPLVKSGRHPPAKNGQGVKSSSYLESTDESLSPRPAPRATQGPPVAPEDEREIVATPDNDTATVTAAWTAARGGLRNPAAERDVAASAHQLLAAAWPLPDVIALAEDMARRQPTYRDLTRHADHWQPVRVVAAAAPGLPVWCEKCGDGNDAAERNPKFRRLNGGPCPNCHPDAAAAA